MTVFSFDVTVSTHDHLKRGITELPVCGSQNSHHRIVIAAENRMQASLDAAAMVLDRGFYLTGLYDRI